MMNNYNWFKYYQNQGGKFQGLYLKGIENITFLTEFLKALFILTKYISDINSTSIRYQEVNARDRKH